MGDISWFIDAIDLRGGLAVATRRVSDLRSPGLQEGTSFFVSPPDFVAERIVARSTGFALASRYGQFGLFNEDGIEVPFDSIAAVAEFVRRAFLRGSGGDGPAESGGSPPPSPLDPEDLPPFPAFADTSTTEQESISRQDPARSVIAFALSANCISAKLGPGMAEAPPLLNSLVDVSAHGLPGRRLARGALRVIIEFVLRRPEPSSPDLLEWAMAAHRLAIMLSRMGLWPLVADELGQSGQLVNWLVHRANSLPMPTSGRDLPSYLAAHLGLHWDWHWHPDFAYSVTRGHDPFRDLALMPIPLANAPALNARLNPKKSVPSLQGLLTSLAAAPTEKLLCEPSAQANAELVFFAAAWVNIGSDAAPYLGSDILAAPFADRVAHRAIKWLSTNLPQLVFSVDTEKIIEAAIDVDP